jgi:hypothetical protein
MKLTPDFTRIKIANSKIYTPETFWEALHSIVAEVHSAFPKIDPKNLRISVGDKHSSLDEIVNPSTPWELYQEAQNQLFKLENFTEEPIGEPEAYNRLEPLFKTGHIYGSIAVELAASKTGVYEVDMRKVAKYTQAMLTHMGVYVEREEYKRHYAWWSIYAPTKPVAPDFYKAGFPYNPPKINK